MTAPPRIVQEGSRGPLRMSVIVPVRDGGRAFRECLEALARSTRPPDEVIVVDDASTDGSAQAASDHGARVIRETAGPVGPARCRNLGARVATGDVLVFIDADVRVHEGALGRIEGYLTTNPQIAAVFGSYDDDPPHRNLVSRYKNLSHHFVHQSARRDAVTFWSALGAIRRDVFVAMGGFDERYRRPSIEDIELGSRLSDAGHRVWLCRDVQGTHLKRWTLASMLRCDIFDRAIPWSRLIAETSRLPSDLNLGYRDRLSAMSAWALVAAVALGSRSSLLRGLALLMAAGIVVLNSRLYRFLLARGGIVFTMGAAILHFLYLLYSSAVFGVVWLGSSLRRRRKEPRAVPVETPRV
jgi:glycosyltransferase involved in cell wall biosynthesis